MSLYMWVSIIMDEASGMFVCNIFLDLFKHMFSNYQLTIITNMDN